MSRTITEADWAWIAPPPPELSEAAKRAAEDEAHMSDAEYLRKLFREQN